MLGPTSSDTDASYRSDETNLVRALDRWARRRVQALDRKAQLEALEGQVVPRRGHGRPGSRPACVGRGDDNPGRRPRLADQSVWIGYRSE